MWNFMSRRVRRDDKSIIWLYKEKIPRNDPNFTTSSFNNSLVGMEAHDHQNMQFF